MAYNPSRWLHPEYICAQTAKRPLVSRGKGRQDTKLSLFVSFRNRIYWFCHTVCESIAKSDAKEIWPLNNWLISISYSIFSHLNFDYRLIINCESTFTQKLFLFGLVKIMLYSNLSKKNTNTKTYCDNGHWFSLRIFNKMTKSYKWQAWGGCGSRKDSIVSEKKTKWKQFSVVGTTLMQLWSGKKTDWESTREPSMEWRQKLMQPWSSD